MQGLTLTAIVCSILWLPVVATGQATRDTAAYQRIKTFLDSVLIIDTHDHLRPFGRLLVGPGHAPGLLRQVHHSLQSIRDAAANPAQRRRPGGQVLAAGLVGGGKQTRQASGTAKTSLDAIQRGSLELWLDTRRLPA